jgi:hypothetical protein
MIMEGKQMTDPSSSATPNTQEGSYTPDKKKKLEEAPAAPPPPPPHKQQQQNADSSYLVLTTVPVPRPGGRHVHFPDAVVTDRRRRSTMRPSEKGRMYYSVEELKK